MQLMDLLWARIYQYLLTEEKNVEVLFHKKGKLYFFPHFLLRLMQNLKLHLSKFLMLGHLSGRIPFFLFCLFVFLLNFCYFMFIPFLLK